MTTANASGASFASAGSAATTAKARYQGCTILLVDDEPANLDLLEALLESEGYRHLVRCADPREVLALVAAHAPDLVLLDLHMPHRHGLDVLADLQAAVPPGDYRPVLVLTADATWDARERALALGARDFVTKPFEATEVLLRVENLLEARTLHAEQNRLLALAELATRERERLLAVVAHDLRNPLGAVALYAEMLRAMQPDEGGDAYVRGALDTIHESVATMQRLVEDLLDTASLRGDALSVKRVLQPLAPIFDEAAHMLAPLARAASLSFTVTANGGDATAEVDRPRLIQLLSNLVGNAVKFTPAGGQVSLGWSVENDVLRGSVSDTGPGVDADDLPHLFTAFWRRDRSGAGAGLGLWIARAIVEAHDGTLRVVSRPGEGTTFHFVIPTAAPPARRWED